MVERSEEGTFGFSRLSRLATRHTPAPDARSTRLVSRDLRLPPLAWSQHCTPTSPVVLLNSTMIITYAYKKYKAKKQAKEEKKRATAAASASQDPDAQSSQGPQQPRVSSEAKQESEQ